MISKFITTPRNVQLRTRCTSIAKFCTTRKLPEEPQKRSQASVGAESKPNYGQNYLFDIEEKTENPLSAYPTIEKIFKLDAESFLRSNHHIVKYGDYEYTECKEGYMQIFIKSQVNKRDIAHVTAAYGVCFGANAHPLNLSGRVIGEETQRHANLYAVLKALESLPTNSFKKICICTCDLQLMKAITRQIPIWAENGYYLRSDPGLRCRNRPKLEKLNEYFRLNPFTYRMRLAPADCGILMMKLAEELARAGAKK